MEQSKNDDFIKNFNVENHGFYDPIPYIDGHIGFSFKKKFNDYDVENLSLFSIFISKNIFSDEKIIRKPLNIYITYGKQTESGVQFRSDISNLSEPLDLEFPNEYFYDIKTNELYNGDKKITATKLLTDTYNRHIKSTKFVLGFFTRAKITFWRSFMKSIFIFLSNIFYFILFTISGDRYTYEYILQEETLNGKVIKSKFRKIDEVSIKETLKESEKVEFFGLKVSRWSIIFYSIVHFSLYWVFVYINYKPKDLWRILENNFLTVIYVVLSFWIIEVPIPKLCKFLIKYFSILSANFQYKKIKI